MDNPIISIIVPCYNRANLISHCLESLMSQTIINKMEIIVVDGGSTDNIKEVVNKFKKIKFFTTNKGVPGQIAKGVKEAKGKYLGFVDSDDFVDERMYEIMLKVLIENHCEISICQDIHCSINSYNSPIKLNNYNLEYTPITKEFMLHQASRCNKLMKKEIADEICLFYNETKNNIKIWEDTIFGYVMNRLDRKVIAISLRLYHYCVNTNSFSSRLTTLDDLNSLESLYKTFIAIDHHFKTPNRYRNYFHYAYSSINDICINEYKKCHSFHKRKTKYKIISNSYIVNEIRKINQNYIKDKSIKKIIRYLTKHKYFSLDLHIFFMFIINRVRIILRPFKHLIKRRPN